MSTSATNKKTSFVYLLIAIFTAFAGAVYEYYSHGVYSNAMLYAFAYPLVGGTLSFSTLDMLNTALPPTLARNAWHSGIATLTVGSVIKGVLEIYGTTNSLTAVYTPIGVALLATAVVFYILKK